MTEEQALFVDDAREIIERLYRDVEELQVARLEGRRRRELAAQIFRRMHTLKGSGASLGFNSISKIAHVFESVLDGARLGRIELTDSVLETFEDALDEIAGALESLTSADSAAIVERVCQRLVAIAATSRQQAVIASGLREALPDDMAPTLSEYDLQHAREAIREGARLFTVTAAFALETFDHDFRQLSRLLGESGEVIATLPGRPTTAEEINFRLLYAAEFLSSETLRRASAVGRIDHSEIKIAVPPGKASTAPGFSAEPRPRELANSPLRIELRQLDELISTASELSRQAITSLLSVAAPSNADAVEAGVKNLRARFTDFEERLIKLRLAPARDVFERALARGGRMTARQLGKKVEFEIVGGDVGIEKSLAEVVADPLLHLVRNAITHGIEQPNERKAAGKNPAGKVTLAASNHSGRIHITVTDDGRGIDVERVVAAAAEHGIASTGLSLDQCLRLIFRPGFSTSANLSELAGRGIGLDIVDRSMDTAGGEARVATSAGAGTTFAMIIPSALSLIRCVVVNCAGRLYAIDAACVAEAGNNHAPEVQPVESDLTDLPGRSLRSLLGESGEATNAETVIAWQAPPYSSSSNGGQQYRIGVDAVITRQETLIRGLGRHASRWPGVCGAAEMFDGNVALVLDLEELIRNN
jgi:two-component system, chemotaxis family, sensor kinase CheA